MTGDLFGASAQTALLDDPAKTRALSQWHTPPRLVRRVVHDLVGSAFLAGAHVVEPSAGSGAFVDELLLAVGACGRITAVELDSAWAEHLRARYAHEPRVEVVNGNYLATNIACDLVIGNPPYEDGNDCAFMSHALDCAGAFAFVMQTRVLHGREREEQVWSRAAALVQGVCVGRPSFGGGAAKGEFSAFLVTLMKPGEERPACAFQRWSDDWRGQ